MARRSSRMSGERIDGEAALPPYAWPGELRAGEEARFYYTRIGGEIARAAVVLRRGPDGEPLVLQAAEAVTRRLAGPTAASPSGLPAAFAAGALLMFAAAAWAALRARRWIVRSLRGFE